MKSMTYDNDKEVETSVYHNIKTCGDRMMAIGKAMNNGAPPYAIYVEDIDLATLTRNVQISWVASHSDQKKHVMDFIVRRSKESGFNPMTLRDAACLSADNETGNFRRFG